MEYQIARLLIKTIGLKQALKIYNRFASDTSVEPIEAPLGVTLYSGDVKLPPFYDISHWKIVTNWDGISPAPLLMGTKATQGTSYKDPTFIEYFQNFKTRVHCRRLAYHFFEKTMDAVKQANWFCDFIAPYVTDEDILCLDFEQGGETASQLWAFVDRTQTRFPNNLIAFYSRKNIVDPISMTAAEKEFFQSFPFWTAGYPNDYSAYTTTPAGYIPDQSKWGPVWFWQYTDQGPVQGIEGGADSNLIEPDAIEWLGAPTPPQPEPGGKMIGKVIIGALNIRAHPADTNNTTNPPIGQLKLNDIVESDYETESWWHITKILRAGVALVLPGPACYAYEGANNGYIQVVTLPPPAQDVPPQEVIVTDDQGVKWKATTFTKVV